MKILYRLKMEIDEIDDNNGQINRVKIDEIQEMLATERHKRNELRG